MIPVFRDRCVCSMPIPERLRYMKTKWVSEEKETKNGKRKEKIERPAGTLNQSGQNRIRSYGTNIRAPWNSLHGNDRRKQNHGRSPKGVCRWKQL